MRCRARGRIPTGEVPATSEKWGFLGVLIYGRGDSLAYVNRQVCILKSISQKLNTFLFKFGGSSIPH